MSTVDRAQIHQLLNQAVNLGAGPTQLGLLEEAVRLSDLLCDISLGYATRMKLIELAPHVGAPDRALVALSWCVAQYDRDPQRYPAYDFLWKYRWLIGFLHGFPQISREQITKALDDFRSRILRAGFQIEVYELAEMGIRRKLGDDFDYLEKSKKIRSNLRRDFRCCATCDLGIEVELLAEKGRDEEALIKAHPILNEGWKCVFYPQRTQARVLLPLLRLGRVAEAMSYHLSGFRLIAREAIYLYEVAQHIDFLVLTDNLAKALKLFETHFPWFEGAVDFEDRYSFGMTARFLLGRLASADRKTLTLRLSPKFPLFQESGHYSTLALRDWFDAEAVEIVGRFDARNGNDFYTRRYRQHLELSSLITPFPLRKLSRAKLREESTDVDG